MQTPPELEIRRLMKEQGKITFAEFMNIALYHPNGGYYTKPSVFGASGDYYTSATVHPTFGALLSIQLHRIWQLLERPDTFYVVELGAGNGLLAGDILDFSVHMCKRFQRSLRYLALERYANVNESYSGLRHSQRIVTDRIPLKGVVGCIISNELVDSFPFHRFRIEGGETKEVFVSLDEQGNIVEVLDNPPTKVIANRLGELSLSLPDGYSGEVNPNISPWLRQVSDALERGFVITIDYGYEAQDLYSPERPQGTFETFYRHTRGSSPYQRIGRQDITAHVDFSLLISEGEKVGLNHIALITQAEFLERLGFREMVDVLRARNLSQRDLQSNMMGMLELVKPDGFGAFKVLVQGKGTGVLGLDELTYVGSPEKVPLMRQDHTPLLEGRYPHLTWEMDSLWPFDDGELEED